MYCTVLDMLESREMGQMRQAGRATSVRCVSRGCASTVQLKPHYFIPHFLTAHWLHFQSVPVRLLQPLLAGCPISLYPLGGLLKVHLHDLSAMPRKQTRSSPLVSHYCACRLQHEYCTRLLQFASVQCLSKLVHL